MKERPLQVHLQPPFSKCWEMSQRGRFWEPLPFPSTPCLGPHGAKVWTQVGTGHLQLLPLRGIPEGPATDMPGLHFMQQNLLVCPAPVTCEVSLQKREAGKRGARREGRTVRTCRAGPDQTCWAWAGCEDSSNYSQGK